MSSPSQSAEDIDFDTQLDEEENTEDVHIDNLPVANSTKEHTYVYDGVTIRFPYAAYQCQQEMMQEIIKGVQNSQNCLLESPTGTGKTAALLCSLLAWQQKYIEDAKIQDESPPGTSDSPSRSEKESEKESDIIDETLPSTCTIETEIVEKTTEPESEKNPNVQKRQKPESPKIYYATRTHTQIKAVVTQLKKTAYSKVPMTILGSREQFCVNPEARKKAEESTSTSASTSKQSATSQGDIINKFCEDLRALAVKENKEFGSPGFFSSSKCSYHTSSHKQNFIGFLKDKGAVDIEDLVTYGKEHNKCPYYGSRDLIDGASIIFCTYNHLLQRAVRAACGVKFENSVFVFDEAHNIETSCANQGSFEVSLDRVDEVKQLLEEAEQKPNIPEIKREPLRTLKVAFTHLSKWLRSQSHKNEILNFKPIEKEKKYGDGGERIFKMFKRDLNAANFAKFNTGPSFSKRARLDGGAEESFPDMMRSALFGPEHLRGLWSAFFYMEDRHKRYVASDEDEIFKLDKKVVNFISSLLSTLQYLFKREERQSQSQSQSESASTSNFTPTLFPRLRDYKIDLFNYVYLSGKESMKLVMMCLNPALVFEKMKECRTVIVTSGTLSPIKSFQAELGVPFERTMISQHVLSQDRIYVGVIDRFKEKTKELKLVSTLYGGQRGRGLRADVGKIILDICKVVPNGILVFVPSKNFLHMIKQHFSQVQILEKIKKEKPGGIFWETDLEKQNKRMPEMIAEYEKEARDRKKGAVLFAYCRGKVSEGVDFADDSARAVITVGIPHLPPYADKIKAKKEYNDARCRFGSPAVPGDTFNGRNWYESSAYRSLNQAFGRCIRHSLDWGVICMIDSRLTMDRRQLSTWVTSGITEERTGNLQKLLPEIREFVRRLTTEKRAP